MAESSLNEGVRHNTGADGRCKVVVGTILLFSNRRWPAKFFWLINAEDAGLLSRQATLSIPLKGAQVQNTRAQELINDHLCSPRYTTKIFGHAKT